ncbi:MAG: acyl-ACP--UDP-N-acetylglucosamine O-acyltransferase [Nitrospirae bacterium]|nr:acyl-ACP--UDP-N-acetylglucosamine O-acyltransferase [Nitrospirota bacterium]
MTRIHSTAVIHPKARIAEDVEVGPYAVIGEHVRLHKETQVAAHVVIDGWTEIGEGCRIFPFASIGTIPQDLKFKGEKSHVVIGNHNTIREYVTVNRGTEQGGGVTKVGDHNLLMAYVHVAHDCRIGDHVILANAATLAGHITVQDYAVIGGLTGLHQFVRIGRHAIIGGCSAVPQDVPPFVSAVGNRAKLYGLNSIGLKRHGFSDDQMTALKTAYKILFRSKLSMKEAVQKIREELSHSPEAQELAAFVETSERGVCR